MELEDHPTAQATVGDAQSPGSPVLPSLGHRAPRPLYWAPTLYGLLTASPAQGGALGRGLRAPTCMPPPSELLLTLGPPQPGPQHCHCVPALPSVTLEPLTAAAPRLRTVFHLETVTSRGWARVGVGHPHSDPAEQLEP